MENVSPEILQFITSFGVGGVLLLWLWDVRSQLREERANHQQTRLELKEALKDCNRDRELDTRRLPGIPEAEKEAYRKRHQEPL